MKENSKVSMIGLAVVIVGLAATNCAFAQSKQGLPAFGQSGFRHCSEKTLSGDYGFFSEGVLLPAPGVSLQIRVVGLAHFDGRGNLTWVEHTIIDGVLQQPGFDTTATGVYDVDPGCTGTAVIHTPNSKDPLNLGLVILKQGAEVHSMLDTHAIHSVFTRID